MLTYWHICLNLYSWKQYLYVTTILKLIFVAHANSVYSYWWNIGCSECSYSQPQGCFSYTHESLITLLVEYTQHTVPRQMHRSNAGLSLIPPIKVGWFEDRYSSSQTAVPILPTSLLLAPPTTVLTLSLWRHKPSLLLKAIFWWAHKALMSNQNTLCACCLIWVTLIFWIL